MCFQDAKRRKRVVFEDFSGNKLQRIHFAREFDADEGFMICVQSENHEGRLSECTKDTLAQKGGTTSPLYADNETQLLAKLTDAIKQAISGRLTFTTPAVMSDVSKGDFIYQATFEYEKNKQWKGSVKKHKLNSNGSFGAVQWDAPLAKLRVCKAFRLLQNVQTPYKTLVKL